MKKIGIVGATGYTGEELLKILSRHDGVEVVFATSERLSGESLTGTFPQLVQFKEMSFCSAEESLTRDVDLVFLCLHAGDSAKWAQKFLQQNVRVIDLGSDFRFRHASAYVDWYNMQHPHPELLPEAVYGLTEWHRREVADARLVGNPGCYPTSIILALAPLLKKGLLEPRTIIADSKSGASGAGRSASTATLFCEVTDGFRAYKVGNHRHTPEIEQEVSALCGQEVKLTFTPHLLPVSRGILSTVYASLSREVSQDEVAEVYADFYRDEFFVRVLAGGAVPATQHVRGSNFCDIGFKVDARTGRIIILSAIDNIVKGAAGQAVQNLNLMYGFEQTESLL